LVFIIFVEGERDLYFFYYFFIFIKNGVLLDTNENPPYAYYYFKKARNREILKINDEYVILVDANNKKNAIKTFLAINNRLLRDVPNDIKKTILIIDSDSDKKIHQKVQTNVSDLKKLFRSLPFKAGPVSQTYHLTKRTLSLESKNLEICVVDIENNLEEVLVYFLINCTNLPAKMKKHASSNHKFLKKLSQSWKTKNLNEFYNYIFTNFGNELKSEFDRRSIKKSLCNIIR